MTSVSQSPRRRYRFEDLILDTGQRRLWRGDEQIQLSKLTFDFLRALVEAAPNLLTQDQLAKAVWGPQRVITPENVSQRLKMLRHALGEQADRPRYIEAVRGQGYRLLVEVEAVESLPGRDRPKARRLVAAGRRSFVLPERFAADAERLARFEREAEVLASLNHPNIARIHGLERRDGTTALVMELVEGPTLADRISQGPIPPEEALGIALQIADALEAAHEKGVVHRDLKPANVKLRQDGTVKVLDFGIAEALEPQQETSDQTPSLTMPAMAQQGLVLGTAGYMSPEQVSGQATDQRADIWAFGVVLYEMLTGLPLFGGESVPRILAEVLKTEPDWKRLPPNIHPRLRYLLERCLEKKPRDRYRSMADAGVEVQKVLADPSGVLVYPLAPDTLAGKSRMLLAAALVAAVVVSALATGFAVWSLKPSAIPVVRFTDVLPELSFRAAVLSRRVIAVSRDGTRVAYSSGADIFIRDLDQPSSRRVQAVAGVAFAPSFSPDGQWLAYAEGLGSISVKRLPVAGGTPQVVVQDLEQLPRGLVWDERNLLLFVQSEGILEVSPEGGMQKLIVRAAEGEELASPQLLPGADAVLFTATTASGSGRWDAGQIVVQSLVSDERTVVWRGGSDARYIHTGHLVYAQGRALFAVPFDLDRRRVTGGPIPVVQRGITRAIGETGSDTAQYAVSDNGTVAYLEVPALDDVPRRALAWADREGKREPIDVRPDDYTMARVSPDGTQVALVIGDAVQRASARNPDIWILDLETQNLRQLTFGFAADGPVWSTDSSLLYFRSLREGAAGVYAVAASGGAPQLIYAMTAEASLALPWSLTPDGQTLVLLNARTFQDMNLATLALDAPEAAARLTPLLDDPAPANEPVIAPNGAWMADVEQGAVGIRPFPDVRRQLIPVGKGHHPVFSRNGSELYYFDGSSVVAAPVQYEPALRIDTPRTLFGEPYWYESAGRAWDPHPDGDRFLMILPPEQVSENASPRIDVVVNWFEELKRLVPKK